MLVSSSMLFFPFYSIYWMSQKFVFPWRTDKPSYRDVRTNLKSDFKNNRGCIPPSVRWSIGPIHMILITEKWDTRAEIEQNSIENIKVHYNLTIFKGKYASRLPERIWRLNSIRLIWWKSDYCQKFCALKQILTFLSWWIGFCEKMIIFLLKKCFDLIFREKLKQ